MPRDDRVYLQHIRDAIRRVEEYTKGIDEPSFSKNTLIQDGVIRQLEIIGEAVKRLSPAYRSSHPTIPWPDIARMRDKLIHDYFGIDIEKVWLTVQEDLHPLRKEVDQSL
jgi:uncharacterized protein with HEPN domain